MGTAENASYTVLVADDDRDIATMLSRYLGGHGVKVTVVHDGREALESVVRQPPDAVVLDLMMPGLTGGDVLAAIRAHPTVGRTPVVVLSASIHSAVHEREIAASMQASAAFRKPVPLRELLQRLDELVGQTSGRFRPAAERSEARLPPILERPPGESARTFRPAGGPATPAAIADAIVDIFDHELNAVLTVKTGSVTRTVYFQAGLMARSHSPLLSERLGAQLVNEGILDRVQDADAGAAMEVSGLRYAEAVMRECGVHPSVLVEALERQQAGVVARAMLARDSTFQVRQWRNISRLGTLYRLDPIELIQRACIQTMRPDESIGLLSQLLGVSPDEEPCLLRSDAFEDRLFLLSRLRPRTVVPQHVMNTPLLSDVMAQLSEAGPDALSDLCALVLSGALRVDSSQSTAPKARRATVLGSGRGGWRPKGLAPEHVDVRERIAAEWLRMGGLRPHEILGVAGDAPAADVTRALRDKTAEFGPPAFSGADLGPATGYLAVVRALRDDAAMVLLDPELRRREDEANALEPS